MGKGKWELGIRDLKLFNFALFGKWIGRFLCESDSLWVKAIKSSCESFGKKVDLNLASASSSRRRNLSQESMSRWWADICKLFWGKKGVRMNADFSRVVGDESRTEFWSESWVDVVPLKAKFNHLYRICEQRESKVSENGHWGPNGWEWELKLTRVLRRGDDSRIEELMNCLNGYNLYKDSVNYCSWNHLNNGG